MYFLSNCNSLGMTKSLIRIPHSDKLRSLIIITSDSEERSTRFLDAKRDGCHCDDVHAVAHSKILQPLDFDLKISLFFDLSTSSLACLSTGSLTLRI